MRRAVFAFALMRDRYPAACSHAGIAVGSAVAAADRVKNLRTNIRFGLAAAYRRVRQAAVLKFAILPLRTLQPFNTAADRRIWCWRLWRLAAARLRTSGQKQQGAAAEKKRFQCAHELTSAKRVVLSSPQDAGLRFWLSNFSNLCQEKSTSYFWQRRKAA